MVVSEVMPSYGALHISHKSNEFKSHPWLMKLGGIDDDSSTWYLPLTSEMDRIPGSLLQFSPALHVKSFGE